MHACDFIFHFCLFRLWCSSGVLRRGDRGAWVGRAITEAIAASRCSSGALAYGEIAMHGSEEPSQNQQQFHDLRCHTSDVESENRCSI